MQQARFAHILNPVSETENKELFTVQQFSFKSISKAKWYAAQSNIQVENFAIFGEGNSCALPGDFTILPELKRNSSQFAATKKKFPVLRDILFSMYENSTAEYLVYTNLDICLMPNFYTSVNALIEKGHDAIIINRRRIELAHLEHGNLELMYADTGEIHSGYDTFVFHRDLLKKFILGDIVIGVPPIGSDLFYNIFVFAENPVLETHKHLTFHIGMDLIKPWGDKAILAFNKTEYKKILKEIGPKIDITRFPVSQRFFMVRYFKWLMNPTVSFPLMVKKDLQQLGKKRKSRKKKEIPGLYQRYLEWMVKKIDFE